MMGGAAMKGRAEKKSHVAIAWRWEQFADVGSTNAIAMEKVKTCWARGQPAEGIAVVARRQTAGRGQHGRQWESPPGGLYLSAVVENVPGPAREKLALLAGLAVVDALQDVDGYTDVDRARRERWGVEAQIRWPNDVIVGGKKVAGILCEGLGQGDRWAAVIGVGVNVSTEQAEFSGAVASRATSLWLHDGRARNMDGVGRAVLRCMDELLILVRAEGMRPIIEKVGALDGLRGKRITFDAGVGNGGGGREIFDAVAEGIDATGALVLRRIETAAGGGLGAPQAFVNGSVLAE